MRKLVPWLLLFGVVAAIELAVRFVFPFQLTRVLLVEAALFLASGLAAYVLVRRSRQAGWRYGLQWALVCGFGLAALRSGLWALGLDVSHVNLIIAVLGALTLLGAWLRPPSAA